MGTVTGARQRRKPASSGSPEDVLCVARTAIFPDGAWHGLVTTGLERILRIIRAVSEYHPRHLVEGDPRQQQIVPYCIVRHHQDGSYLLTRRLGMSSEKRLHHLYSLGVGGHVNPGDGRQGDPVRGGLIREWGEEVVCVAPATARLVAVLNDDTSPVSRVHLGLVFIVEPERGLVSIRERDKLEGECLSLEAMRRHYLSMETWSQLVYDDLIAGAPERAESSPMVVQMAATPGAGDR